MIFHKSKSIKPYIYPTAVEYAFKHEENLHWAKTELNLGGDIKDYENMHPEVRGLCDRSFKSLTHADVEIGNFYVDELVPNLNCLEYKMLFSSIGNREQVLHSPTYDLMNTTIGLRPVEYIEFTKIKAVKAKQEYYNNLPSDSFENLITKWIATYLSEAVQLRSAFVTILNFPRNNLMKGMGQAISWIMRDEDFHVLCNLMGIKQALKWKGQKIEDYEEQIYEISMNIVELEHQNINYIFGDFNDNRFEKMFTKQQAKDYVGYLNRNALIDLDLRNLPKLKNPLPLELYASIQSVNLTNFFETTATDYAKGATQGTWEEVRAMIKI